MPRKSAAALAVVPPRTGPDRLSPPHDLGAAEREVWRSIVACCEERHFQASDTPLLVRYCENYVIARHAGSMLAAEGPVVNGKPSPWLRVAEIADRILVALSMRLRISPQARLPREVMKPGRTSSPYEVSDD